MGKKSAIKDELTPSSSILYCECMGSIHGLYTNCTSKNYILINDCGKILCKLESLGPCPFCGSSISKTDPYNTDKKSLEFQTAINQKLRLLKLDSSTEKSEIHGNFYIIKFRYCSGF